jgi:biotin transport system substrate-specific component
MRSRNHQILLVALFIALTGVGGYLRIPFYPVPFTLQTMFVYLSGILLGKKHGLLCQSLFLFLGLMGLPIFVFGGGPGYFLQPTFGYLLAFPLGAWLIGWILESFKSEVRFSALILIHIPSLFLIYSIGMLYLYISLNFLIGKKINLSQTLISGCFIFLPSELIKICISAILTKRIRKIAMFLTILSFFQVNYSHAQRKPDLIKVREEIRRLETEINAKEVKESSILEQLEVLDRAIGLQQRLMQELKYQINDKEKAVSDSEKRMKTAVQSYQNQKNLVARRLVSLYKRGRMADWEALVSVKSANQALVYIKYQKIIIQNDQRNLRLLEQKREAVKNQKGLLEKELFEKQQLVAEAQIETVRLETNKTARKRMLSIVRREKEPLLEQLHQKRLAYQEIESWIAREEEKRTEEERKRKLSTVEKPIGPLAYTELNQKIIWPVKGQVISKYGRHMDARLKTWTENLGVEIEASEGDVVRAVAAGNVKRVDWLRGMGNLVFLDHGGFYTIYGHMEGVFVNLGDNVSQGKEIGLVGDRNSFYGSTLHFEIWKGKTHYDPELWLK